MAAFPFPSFPAMINICVDEINRDFTFLDRAELDFTLAAINRAQADLSIEQADHLAPFTDAFKSFCLSV